MSVHTSIFKIFQPPLTLYLSTVPHPSCKGNGLLHPNHNRKQKQKYWVSFSSSLHNIFAMKFKGLVQSLIQNLKAVIVILHWGLN